MRYEVTRSEIPNTLAKEGVQELDPEQVGELSAEQDKYIDRLMDELLQTDDLVARYRIEIIFLDNRSAYKPFQGIVTAWVNGNDVYGDCDTSLYFCPAKVETETGYRFCNAPILPDLIDGDRALCSTCNAVSTPEDLTGQIFARLPFQGWATLIERLFNRLEGHADLRMGIFKGDLINTAHAEHEKPRKGDKLYRVYRDREFVLYSLKDLVKDLSTGASLTKRIRAFLGG